VRVVVLTANEHGVASRFLLRPLPSPIEIVGVFFDEGASDRRQWLRSRLRKVRLVGIGGALAGLVLRAAYANAATAPSVFELGINVDRIETLNNEAFRRRLRERDVDVALSLGNRLLSEETFSIPRLATVNVHHGAVPDYRGGPPVFWELKDGLDDVGYTIHRVDSGIDTGPVLAAGRVPIVRAATIADTLAATLPTLHDASLDALELVLAALARGEARAQPQPPTRSSARTTPRLVDYLAVRRLHRDLRQNAARSPSA
jgi:folate-dependent phosphoribosylglycinamide formyltransferase PurN